MISTGEAIATIVALASVWAMTGVIWVIQVVHYPIFDSIERGVGDENWRRFGDRHRSGISFVVGPFMLAEGLTGLWLAIDPPGDMTRVLPLIALSLMAVAYGTTAFVSVPLHERLTEQFDPQAHTRLVATNWIRTAAWTTRALLVAVIAVVAVIG
ncbi:MAG: hypothetical protein P8O03_14860 [Ilumatobacter sp.]|nr:hypothetical protein [bacterium]MDG1267594.1 hypothetical protein [Ilumatobacter sp.]